MHNVWAVSEERSGNRPRADDVYDKPIESKEIFTALGLWFVCWLLNVPATCKCISGTDLLRQFYVLPH